MKFPLGTFSVTRLESELWLGDPSKTWKTGNLSSSSSNDTLLEVEERGISLQNCSPCRTWHTACPKQGRPRAYFRASCHRNDEENEVDLQGTAVCQPDDFLSEDFLFSLRRWTYGGLNSLTALIYAWDISEARHISNVFARLSFGSRRSLSLTLLSAMIILSLRRWSDVTASKVHLSAIWRSAVT